jgi:hypothetical protein
MWQKVRFLHDIIKFLLLSRFGALIKFFLRKLHDISSFISFGSQIQRLFEFNVFKLIQLLLDFFRRSLRD